MEATADPTEAEIRAACERIQQSWSAAERASRRRGMLPGERHARAAMVDERFTVPMIVVDAELAALLNVAS